MNLNIQMNKKTNLVVLLIGCCLTTVANAQIEEVVVTAQKRTESVQEVPISITAFDAGDIRDAGIQNIEDVAFFVPNLSLQDNGLVSRFSMRGVNLNSITDASESPIAIYTDGVYIGTNSNFRASLFDIERIEVVRGPQGTLYGRNATGGLVNFISAEPSEEFGGYASVQYGRFDKVIAEGAVNAPLGDHIRARLSVKSDTDSGYQENVTDGANWHESDMQAARFQLAIDISDNAELLLNVHGSDQEGVGPGYGLFGNRDPGDPTYMTVCSNERTLNGDCVSSSGEAGTGHPTRVNSGNPKPVNEKTQWGAFARLAWDITENVQLTSLSAYEQVEKQQDEDGDGTVAAPLNIGARNDYDQFSQELRLNGAYGKADWVAGFYYFTSEANVLGEFRFVPGPFADLADSVLETDAWALFGDIRYAISDTLTFSGGLRYSDEEKSHAGVNTFAVAFGFGGPVFFDHEVKDDVVTWRAALDWQVNDDVMLYANYSTGFKSPGYQAQYIFTTDPFAASASEREEVDAIELGFKSQLYGNRLVLNVAGFYYDYEGLQQVLTVPNPVGLNTPVLSNIDQADIYGIEVDIDFVPNEHVEFYASLGFIDNEVEDSDPAFDGNEVAATPRWNYNLMGRLNYPLGGTGTVTLQASYSWQDDVFFGVDNDPLERFESYGVADARLIWRSMDEKYVLEAYVQNLSDEEYLVHSFTSGAAGGGAVGIWGLPRTYGIRATVNF